MQQPTTVYSQRKKSYLLKKFSQPLFICILKYLKYTQLAFTFHLLIDFHIVGDHIFSIFFSSSEISQYL